ncbi:MAG: hypothetical protein M3680_04660 [Myxococcota bacterium]|nr:hypothetical protein [Myxococcota bacterium]
MLLHSRHPMFLWWGPELIQFYNDAYLPSFGSGKHPGAMGQPGRECWPEIWEIIGPQIEGVMARAEATWNEDQLVPISRNGTVEDVYWTYGYSPVFEQGAVRGVLVVCTETTRRVLAVRRLEVTRLLMAAAPPSETTTLHGAAADIPFALVFAIDDGELRVTSASGLADEELVRAASAFQGLAELRMSADDASDGDVCELVPSPLQDRHGVAGQVMFATLRAAGARPITGFVALGISSRVPLEAEYRAFLEEVAHLLSGLRAAALARARHAVGEQQRKIVERMASIATLASGVAHEINNPLTFVQANLEMLLEQLESRTEAQPAIPIHELAQMASDAREGAGRVQRIICDLKTFSRADVEQRTTLDVDAVLDLALGMTGRRLGHGSCESAARSRGSLATRPGSARSSSRC